LRIGLGFLGFVDEFKAAVLGHEASESKGALEVVDVIDFENGVGVFVSNEDCPRGDFFAFFVLGRLGAKAKDAAPVDGVG
jgi:hypothetical protein